VGQNIVMGPGYEQGSTNHHSYKQFSNISREPKLEDSINQDVCLGSCIV
jgi:hypothetical protein